MKTLICIDGITNKKHYLADVLGVVKEAGIVDKIVSICTESVFEEKLIGKLLHYFRIADWLAYAMSHNIQNKLNEETSKVISRYKELGDQVCVVGHSLGSLIALNADAICIADKLILAGSPLTSKNYLLRRRANGLIKKDIAMSIPRDNHYIWSPTDIVCGSPHPQFNCTMASSNHTASTYAPIIRRILEEWEPTQAI
jgi:hypothetical protein